MIIFHILFWFSILLIMHSYLFYPWILQILSTNRKENSQFFSEDELPPVTIIMSVFNEEKILPRKLVSILASNYPKNKLNVLIGSDASTDGTNQILKEYENRLPLVKVQIFDARQGKAAVINKLVLKAEDEYIIMTDAKVIFHVDTVRNLIRNFKNPDIGIVGGNILNERVEKDGVSIQERAFMSREILMKYREGLIWGATVGVYGAIYAIRKPLYTPVPVGFAVDDFFISMNVLRKQKHAIMDLYSISHEEVPNLISEEYRRKVRISTGNYRNLKFFWKEIFTLWKGSTFAYISHKVLRWLGPFLFIIFLISTSFLYNTSDIYNYVLYVAGCVLVLPIIDFFLSKIGIHIVFLRFVRHFVTMNIALLHGFINYLGGIKKDVWKPTSR